MKYRIRHTTKNGKHRYYVEGSRIGLLWSVVQIPFVDHGKLKQHPAAFATEAAAREQVAELIDESSPDILVEIIDPLEEK